ncbi:hypothetical protein PFICI_10556 [Pestalotiopsis fici W106-1]|uniref:Erythromycin biosynthesis protein CIII-like C-terminal domain-containing protein n=1 Tax=Pestalotiopsis fici (strain W106-1 / CGMCC3.15140) TaxID=1229662 RepID=W3WXH4_PESFW|nr:uncharacterized protein PFICI_10556 [Pestalotiopsis fici W106-1]ETS78494.1 hypothetical protein PFICI_10556 [Pestalotiopsis fici W106-1]
MAVSNSTKPILLFVAAAAAGHVTPLLRVASYHIQKGYDVLFLTGSEFKDQVARAGAEWSALEPLDMEAFAPERLAALDAKMHVEMFAYAFDNVFLTSLPKRVQQLRQALEMLHQRDPNREVIIFHEVGAVAVHPFHFGAPLPKGYTTMPKTICLGINPIMVDSEVTGICGPGFPYDDSPAVKARHLYMTELFRRFPFRGIAESHAKKLQEVGCTTWPEYFAMDDFVLTSDLLLQLCGPGFEYPDPTRNPKIKFAGTLPPQSLNPTLEYPSWWSDVTDASAAGKKVVFLAQGTLTYEAEALLLPVIRALQNEEDILLVVAIGSRGASLPSDFELPKHTRVIDYFPYDAVLPYADVFIFNAGYGGASHAIGHGVPIVALGTTGQDKGEVAARIDFFKLGIAIRSEKPEIGEIHSTVRKVLDNGDYKKKALELQKESLDLDPLAMIESQVRELAH